MRWSVPRSLLATIVIAAVVACDSPQPAGLISSQANAGPRRILMWSRYFRPSPATSRRNASVRVLDEAAPQTRP